MLLGIAFTLFVLVAGFTTLVMGISVAVRPSERALLALRPMSTCTVMSIASAAAAGAAQALKNGADAAGTGQQVGAALLAGLAEALVPAFAGFALLAVAWLLAAIGIRRPGGEA